MIYHRNQQLPLLSSEITKSAFATSQVAFVLVVRLQKLANQLFIGHLGPTPNIPHGNKWRRLFVHVTFLGLAKVLWGFVHVSLSGHNVKGTNVLGGFDVVVLLVHPVG